jgi:hypothetical protein
VYGAVWPLGFGNGILDVLTALVLRSRVQRVGCVEPNIPRWDWMEESCAVCQWMTLVLV